VWVSGQLVHQPGCVGPQREDLRAGQGGQQQGQTSGAGHTHPCPHGYQALGPCGQRAGVEDFARDRDLDGRWWLAQDASATTWVRRTTSSPGHSQPWVS
jgi:hypothetical protein